MKSADILLGKILIVDDWDANVLLLRRMLNAAGYSAVSSTTDPREVAALHRRHHYDLILLDVQMPGLDGFAVMEQLQEIEADGYLPVLVITGEAEHKIRALMAGAKDFVSKPFELAEVLMRVRNMLEVRLLHEAARKNAAMLKTLALHDPLTGLANRRLLEERLSMALLHARRNKAPIAVVCLDLDGFKQVNDSIGHAGGDALLRMVAERLLRTVREEDTVARVGGDEFTVGLWHVTSSEHAAAVTRKLIDAVAQPYVIEGETRRVTASAGVGIYPQHGEDVTTLLKSADAALYEAKRAGKNAFRLQTRNIGARLPGFRVSRGLSAPTPDRGRGRS